MFHGLVAALITIPIYVPIIPIRNQVSYRYSIYEFIAYIYCILFLCFNRLATPLAYSDTTYINK